MTSWPLISARERGSAPKYLGGLHHEVVTKWLLFREAKVVSYGSSVANSSARVNHSFITMAIFGCITLVRRSGKKSSELRSLNKFVQFSKRVCGSWYWVAVPEDLLPEVATGWSYTSDSLYYLEATMTILSTSNISTTFTCLTSRTTSGKSLNRQV